MVSIVSKKIHGHEYLYLVTSIRNGKKVIKKTIKYIGKKRPISKEEFACMRYSYENNDWILRTTQDQLPYTFHAKLRKISATQQECLANLDTMSQQKAKEQFLSKFIASSNSLEGSTLTVKETHDFLFDDIVPKHHGKKELFMAINMLDAWEYLEKRVKKLPTHKDLQELHARVNKGIETNETLGKYKKVQNYIGDIYTTSYLFVEEKMEQLLTWIKDAFRKIDNFEVAFQSHAQFEVIHPFIDGNGRVGRLVLNWLLIYKKNEPLAIRSTRRAEYIEALENARRGKVEAIAQFCYTEYTDQYEFI